MGSRCVASQALVFLFFSRYVFFLQFSIFFNCTIDYLQIDYKYHTTTPTPDSLYLYHHLHHLNNDQHGAAMGPNDNTVVWNKDLKSQAIALDEIFGPVVTVH